MSDPGEYGDAPEIAEEIMAGFRRTPRGVSARFTSGQAGVLRNLVSQVAELVGGQGAAEGRPAGAGEGASEGLPLDLAAVFAMDKRSPLIGFLLLLVLIGAVMSTPAAQARHHNQRGHGGARGVCTA